ncbi:MULTISPECIES: branched-chain amino acid ABC transporter permease [unclassified Chelatococcus]|uniref:branched-chain amino acid ABC transporter permease n=1 Tax=unclassified Chelatococcus TaxID=2638111 RepID=UPI001BD177F7|nr:MULTISPECIES: branched-chain amino acid ABC transporter permease [unclassified Chelatococcus]MBS7701400.1 branched-chain amino acid ABC transporter permease [Chelatococcus sp. YT9]MBX3557480.1 branched-chain amino acid ABC transporter permease [Chelatococcus sp.]
MSTVSIAPLKLQRSGRTLPVAQLLLLFAGLGFILVVGLTVESPFLLNLAAYTCGFALFALSVNIILGGVGEVPLGHCMFFGIGAYAPAIAMNNAGLPYELGIAMGMVVAAVAALLIGWLTLRLTGAYFSIVSWGLSGVAMVTVHNLDFAGGALGLFGFSRLAIGPFDFSTPRTYFLATALILLLVLVILAHVRSSRFGRALESIRQGRHLAQSLGINVFRERLKALVLSAPIAALAGSLCLPFSQIVTPEIMSVLRTVDALLAVLIGGTGLLYGPVIGSVIFTVAPQFLNFDANVKVLVFSLLIIFVMMVAPGGLHQIFKALLTRLSRSKAGQP